MPKHFSIHPSGLKNKTTKPQKVGSYGVQELLPSSISLQTWKQPTWLDVRCLPPRVQVLITPLVKVQPKGPSTPGAADSAQPRRAGGVGRGTWGLQPQHTDTATASHGCCQLHQNYVALHCIIIYTGIS